MTSRTRRAVRTPWILIGFAIVSLVGASFGLTPDWLSRETAWLGAVVALVGCMVISAIGDTTERWPD